MNSTIDLAKGSYTYSDLEKFDDEERTRYELSFGLLVVTPAPNTFHQYILGKVVSFLTQNCLESQSVLPEAELFLSKELLKRPDIQVVRTDLVGGQYVSGRPDLVVEIHSPATRKMDLTEKRSVYEEAGIPAYWAIDPDADQGPEVTVLELDASGRYRDLAADPASGMLSVSRPRPLKFRPADLFD